MQSHAGMNRALEAGLQGCRGLVSVGGRLHLSTHGWVPLRFQVVLAFLASTPIRVAGQRQHATLPVRSASEACTPQRFAAAAAMLSLVPCHATCYSLSHG